MNPPVPRRRTRRPSPLHRSRRAGSDRGQVAVEFLGALPWLILGLLAALQLTFAVTAVQSASTAARAASRAVSRSGPGAAQAAATAAVPDWMRGRMTVTSTGSGTVVVRVTMPIVFPGFDGPTVERSATFEPEQGQSPWG